MREKKVISSQIYNKLLLTSLTGPYLWISILILCEFLRDILVFFLIGFTNV